MGWAKLAAGLAEAFSAILAWLGRERDRQAGRDQVRVADLEQTSRILEEQRDEAAKPGADPGAVLDRMRRGGF